MSLPIRISKVDYMVAGSYAYRGDLIITEGIIYYVPFNHLRRGQPPDEGVMFGGMADGLLGAKGVGSAASPLDESIKLFDRPVLDWERLWRSNIPDRELQAVMDSYIAEVKKYPSASADVLPVPGRYTKDDVRNLVLTALGRLKFETAYEEHTFKIGMTKKGTLQQALRDARFIS